MKIIIAWVGLLGVITAYGSDEAVGPATQPAAKISHSAPMPEEFKSLLSRNVFTRKNGAGSSKDVVKLSGSGLALRGIVRDEGGTYTAIIEDPTTHQIQKIENGANLAGGNVSHLTLRGFQYDIGGKRVTVAIGQNLAGEISVVAPSPPAAAPASGAKGKNASGTPPADGDEVPQDAAAQAALVAAAANQAEGAKADNIAPAGANRRGQTSNNN